MQQLNRHLGELIRSRTVKTAPVVALVLLTLGCDDPEHLDRTDADKADLQQPVKTRSTPESEEKPEKESPDLAWTYEVTPDQVEFHSANDDQSSRSKTADAGKGTSASRSVGTRKSVKAQAAKAVRSKRRDSGTAQTVYAAPDDRASESDLAEWYGRSNWYANTGSGSVSDWYAGSEWYANSGAYNTSDWYAGSEWYKSANWYAGSDWYASSKWYSVKEWYSGSDWYSKPAKGDVSNWYSGSEWYS